MNFRKLTADLNLEGPKTSGNSPTRWETAQNIVEPTGQTTKPDLVNDLAEPDAWQTVSGRSQREQLRACTREPKQQVIFGVRLVVWRRKCQLDLRQTTCHFGRNDV